MEWISSGEALEHALQHEFSDSLAKRRLWEGLQDGRIIARAETFSTATEKRSDCIIDPHIWRNHWPPHDCINYEAGTAALTGRSKQTDWEMTGIAFARTKLLAIWPAPSGGIVEMKKPAGGARAQYEWTEIGDEMLRLAYEEGFPETQAEFVKKIQIWHKSRYGKEIGLSQAKQKISFLYKALGRSET